MSSIRTKFTLWYTLVMTFVIIVFAVSSYSLLYINLYSNLEQNIKNQSNQLIDQNLTHDFTTGLQITSDNPDESLSEELSKQNISLRIIDSEKNIVTQFGIFKNQIKPSPTKISTTLIANTTKVSLVEDESGDNNIYLIAPILKNNETVGVIELSQPLANSFKALEQLTLILIIGIIASIIFSVFSGYYLSRRTLGYINELIDNVEAITNSQDLEKRLPVPKKHKDELTRLASTFNNMLKKIQAEFIREKNFTSNVSHDLRTPLTIIQGNVDVALKKKNLTPSEVSKTLNKIKKETKRIDSIISDMLEISNIEHTDTNFYSKIDTGKLISEIVNSFKSKFDQKNIQLVYKKPKKTDPIFVLGNITLLKRLFSNIIDNSIKYNHENGKIIIKLSTKMGKVVILIQDTGEGISSDNLPYIFDRHYQVKKSQTGIKQGIGLGLAIAKEIVKVHSASIEATSQKNVGTKIKLIFPHYS